MKKLSLILIAFVTFFAAFSAAAAQTIDVTKTVTYLDDLEREVTVPKEITSIITLAPSLTETICALGGEALIKAVDINSDYPESMQKAVKVTNWGMEPDYEMMLAVDPDVVFASEMTAMAEISNMEKLGLTVYCVKNPADFDELFESILRIGIIVGKEEESVKLVDELRERVDAVTEAMTGCEERKTVFYELDATDPTKPWTAGKGTFISDIIHTSCGTNLGDELEGDWAQISLEALIQADPEIILLGDAAYGNSPEAVTARTGWGDISAVKNGALYEFDDNLVSRPGPRLVEGLEVIARLLNPERFK